MLDVFGKQWERYTGIALGIFVRKDGTRERSVWCVCECGNIRNVSLYNLNTGRSKSCGCLQKERMSEACKKHGATGTAEYKVWQGMKGRCHNPTHADYYNYGARGITVCDEWRESFEAFLRDMGNRPEGDYTIERVDNDKGYCKDNCIWLLRSGQHKNRRKYRKKGESPQYAYNKKRRELKKQNN